MKSLLDFDDAGAQDDHPARGVTVGDIRAWFDEIERLRQALRELEFYETDPWARNKIRTALSSTEREIPNG